MTRFVELEAVDGKLVWINIEKIVAIREDDRGNVKIWLGSSKDAYWVVKGPINDVVRKTMALEIRR